MPVLLPFRAYRFPVPPEELPELTYVPGEEPPRNFGDVAPIQGSEPALFLYTQRFRFPGEANESMRAGIMGLLVRDEAKVFTHEETCPDRVSACTAAIDCPHTDLGSLWLWCGDTSGELRPLLECAPEPEDAAIEVMDRLGCVHRISSVRDREHIHLIQDALASQRLYLADGHHRYAAGWNLATIQIRTPALRTRAGSRPLPDIDTIERNARAGLLLPPKSTDFHPKLAAGLVMYRHQNDHATPPVAQRRGVRYPSS